MLIRLATPDDAAQIAAIYAPFCGDSPVSFEIEPPAPAQMRERIVRIGETYPWLVAEEESQVLGYVYGCAHRERAAYRWSVDVAVYVHADHRNRGLGRHLYQTLFDLLRCQGFHAAHAGITVPNAASVGLHETLGFRLIGIYPGVGFKAGAWRDVGWWQLRLAPAVPEAAAPPGEPIPVSAARTSPGWLAMIERASDLASSVCARRRPAL